MQDETPHDYSNVKVDSCNDGRSDIFINYHQRELLECPGQNTGRWTKRDRSSTQARVRIITMILMTSGPRAKDGDDETLLQAIALMRTRTTRRWNCTLVPVQHGRFCKLLPFVTILIQFGRYLF